MKNPYEQYVNNAIDAQGEKYAHRAVNSQGTITSMDESHDMPDHDHMSVTVAQTASTLNPGAGIDNQEEMQRQWQWSVAEEMLPAADDARSSQILDEVGRMDVHMDSVADKVKAVKSKLDEMEEEGGVVLNLKDS